MRGNQVLTHFSKDFKYQKYMARSIDRNNGDDLIQEAYMKLHRLFQNRDYTSKDIKADRQYFYLTMRSIFYNKHKKKKITYEIIDDICSDDLVHDPNELELKQLQEERIENIEYVIDNFLHWYDKKMLQLYYYTDMSMRDIARETTISLSNICNTINKSENQIKIKLKL